MVPSPSPPTSRRPPLRGCGWWATGPPPPPPPSRRSRRPARPRGRGCARPRKEASPVAKIVMALIILVGLLVLVGKSGMQQLAGSIIDLIKTLVDLLRNNLK